MSDDKLAQAMAKWLGGNAELARQLTATPLPERPVMTDPQILYEYAGFMYRIELAPMDAAGVISHRAVPLPGQHSAANKDKHRRAALECWQDDGQPGVPT